MDFKPIDGDGKHLKLLLNQPALQKLGGRFLLISENAKRAIKRLVIENNLLLEIFFHLLGHDAEPELLNNRDANFQFILEVTISPVRPVSIVRYNLTVLVNALVGALPPSC